MMDDLMDLGSVLLAIVGMIAAVAFSIFLLMALWASTVGPAGCKSWGEAMQVSTEYRFWNGCFVKMPDGKVLPREVATDLMRQEYKVEMK